MQVKSLESLVFLSFFSRYNLSGIHQVINRAQEGDDLRAWLSILGESDYKEEELEKEWELTRESIQKMEENGVQLIPFYSDQYPPALKEMDDFPPVLYVKGATNWPAHLAAVVGPRDCADSIHVKTEQITRALLEQGYGIVSGLALGVDTIAHEQALQQKGYTLAVLPGHLNPVYPPPNKDLAIRILEGGGTLISELPFGIPLTQRRFVERNRLTTALSQIVLPMELREKGGTLKTIQHALRQRKTLLLTAFTRDPLADNSLQKLLRKQQKSGAGSILLSHHLDEFKVQLQRLYDSTPR